MSGFYKADNNILKILVSEGNYYPVACLTSNDFDQSSDEIDTTTRDNAGWKTSRPTNQSYQVSFEGLETENDVIEDKVTYKDLEALKINRTLISYRIGDQKRIEGRGYIVSLTRSSPSGELTAFSGTLRGFGKYNEYDPNQNNTFDYQLDFYL
jgi:TP901-1 family phage major tail protein